MNGATLYEIPYFVDNRGALNVLEIARELPFVCRRIFYTYTVPEGQVRGEHAHKACEQFLISLRGKVSVSVDDGDHRDEFMLDSPSKGLWLPSGSRPFISPSSRWSLRCALRSGRWVRHVGLRPPT